MEGKGKRKLRNGERGTRVETKNRPRHERGTAEEVYPSKGKKKTRPRRDIRTKKTDSRKLNQEKS